MLRTSRYDVLDNIHIQGESIEAAFVSRFIPGMILCKPKVNKLN